jgi:hypothetical protein
MSKARIAVCFALVLLIGCSSAPTSGQPQESGTAETNTPEPNPAGAAEPEESRPLEVNKGLFSNEVTLPAIFFEGQDMDQVIANAKEGGFDDITANEDGSVTFQMSKEAYEQWRSDTAETVKQTISDILASGDFASIQDIAYNDSFTEFQIVADRAAFENSAAPALYTAIYVPASMFQLIDGASHEEVSVTILLEDAATKEIFGTVVYPDDFHPESGT